MWGAQRGYLYFKYNIVKVVCYILQWNNNRSNEIRNRTGVSPSNSGVSLVKEFVALNDSESQLLIIHS